LFSLVFFWLCSFPGLILHNNKKTGTTYMEFGFYSIGQADGDAALGKYVAGSCVGAAAEYDLFIKNHSY